jgi:hypothetical protein
MAQTRQWTTAGFDGFSKGTFGNAGQNLYVSRAGTLQRIHQFDLNRNGYFDLVFCNDHDNGESAPSYIYRDPLGKTTRTEIPSDGAWAGASADLNGNGYDDIVLGMLYNGTAPELNAFVYYGAADGFSERRRQLLPVPYCISVAAGDFDGDGKPDLAFLRSREMASIENNLDQADRLLRVFIQSELGLEPERFVELGIDADSIAAADLDGDGYDDLVARSTTGAVTVYWGGPGGLDMARSTRVPFAVKAIDPATDPHYNSEPKEARDDARVLAKTVVLNGLPHVFVPGVGSAALVPVRGDRTFGDPLELPCERPMSVAVGDINGDGHEDVVIASRQVWDQGECSWIFWGGPDGNGNDRKTLLPSMRASDVAVGDLTGDGFDDVVICQSRTLDMFTTESLIYHGGPDGVSPEPKRLTTEDARRTFLVRSPSRQLPDVAFLNRFSRHASKAVDSYVYYGGPDGFSPERRDEVPAIRPVASLTFDVNDDGYPDIVFANSSLSTMDHDAGCYVLLNGPDGFPDTPSIVLPSTKAHGIVCADLNRNGYLDLIIGGYMNPELLIYHGTADGFDVAHPQVIRMELDGVLYDDVRKMCLVDLDNDGWLDLVVTQVSFDRSFILWGGPEGFSMDRLQELSIRHAGQAQAADLTGNGYADLIMGGGESSHTGPHGSYAYIYWNGPDGLREDNRTMLPANAVSKLGVADFNNDGTLDLLVCCYHAGTVRDIDSYIYWNRKGRGFSDADRFRFFAHSASGAMVADFNEDGWVDMAIANHKIEGDHVGDSTVYWNGPDGFDERRVTGLPTLGPHGMVTMDPGNIMDRGPEETYVSQPFELPAGATPSAISWEGEVPPKTWVRAQLRFADSSSELEAAEWAGPQGLDTWYQGGEPVPESSQGRWVQYKLALGATSSLSTPRITRVDLAY